MCVMSVVSVMRGLYLIDQTLEIIDCSDENTFCHVMSVIRVTIVQSVMNVMSVVNVINVLCSKKIVEM